MCFDLTLCLVMLQWKVQYATRQLVHFLGWFAWQVNGFLIVFMATSLVHPLYQWFTCHRAERQVNLED